VECGDGVGTNGWNTRGIGGGSGYVAGAAPASFVINMDNAMMVDRIAAPASFVINMDNAMMVDRIEIDGGAELVSACCDAAKDGWMKRWRAGAAMALPII
jgi:hypothetical protein